MRKRRVIPSAVALLALVPAAIACSPKATNSSGTDSGGVKTGPGVSRDTIKLGVLTDLHGQFAASGKAETMGNRLFWDDQNAKGGVCGRKVELVIKDHGYDVQQATTFYAQIHSNVLGMQQLLGAPMTAALDSNIKTDKMLTVPSSWASSLMRNPNIAVTGTTYELEVVNGVDYLLDKGTLKRGDTIGHIYQEGDYGESALLGGQQVAKANDLKLKPFKITGDDTDMTAQVTNLKAAGAKAILLAAGPKQLASVASAEKALGIDIPILVNSVVFAPGVLDTSASRAVQKHMYLTSSWLAPSSTDPTVKKLVNTVRTKHPGTPLVSTLVWGYGSGSFYQKVLAKACANKDLTRDGLHRAFTEIGEVKTGVIAPLNFSDRHTAPADSVYIYRADKDSVGGLKEVSDGLFQGKDARGFQIPTG